MFRMLVCWSLSGWIVGRVVQYMLTRHEHRAVVCGVVALKESTDRRAKSEMLAIISL